MTALPDASRIAIASPGFPGVRGGVTDHTTRLERRWRAWGHEVTVLGTTRILPEAIAAEWAARGVGGVLLQYVPFLYGRRGLSRFPERLARAVRALGIRVTLFVHEPWVPPTRLPWLVLSPLQRRQLRRLVALADSVVTAVPAWRSLLRPDATVIPVGSNLGPPPRAPAERQPAPVVFSPFAAGLLWSWIVAAVEAIGAAPALIVVGADPAGMRRHPETRRWYADGWECRGYLPPSAALSAIATARVALAPFVDGATTRRGSLLAALSTGIPTVTSRGPLYDPLFDSAPIAVAASRGEFVTSAKAEWERPYDAAQRERRLAWYGDHLDPVALDRRLLTVVTGAPA
jgi:hypothetical protein